MASLVSATASVREDVYTVSLPPGMPSLRTEIVRIRDPQGVWSVIFRYPQLVAGTTPAAVNSIPQS